MKRMGNRGELGVQTVKFAGPHGTGSISCRGKEEKGNKKRTAEAHGEWASEQ